MYHSRKLVIGIVILFRSRPSKLTSCLIDMGGNLGSKAEFNKRKNSDSVILSHKRRPHRCVICGFVLDLKRMHGPGLDLHPLDSIPRTIYSHMQDTQS